MPLLAGSDADAKVIQGHSGCWQRQHLTSYGFTLGEVGTTASSTSGCTTCLAGGESAMLQVQHRVVVPQGHPFPAPGESP